LPSLGKNTGRSICNQGWVENDPLEILRQTEEVIAEALAYGGLRRRFRPQTALPLSTYFTGLKLRWLFQNTTATCFPQLSIPSSSRPSGGAKSGVHVTDATTASRTELLQP